MNRSLESRSNGEDGDSESDMEWPEYTFDIEAYMKTKCPLFYRILKQLQAQRAPQLPPEMFQQIYDLLGDKPWLNDEEKIIDKFCPKLWLVLKPIRDQKKIPMELINIIFDFLNWPWAPPVV
jgi:hypothetical protein